MTRWLAVEKSVPISPSLFCQSVMMAIRRSAWSEALDLTHRHKKIGSTCIGIAHSDL